MFKKYREYLKDNPQGYWFKRKLYGWGWTPVKWQGWVVVLVYIGILITASFGIDEASSNREIIFSFLLPVIFMTIILIRICYKKGEKPRWQWGKIKED